MKNKDILKKLVNTGIFTILTLFCSSPDNLLAEDFISEKFNFSLTYDSSFNQADIKLQNVALALNNKTSNFPTFNVVIEHDYLDPDSDKNDKEKEILDSYKLVGIKDVTTISSEDSIINRLPVFKIRLAYTLNQENMISYVCIFFTTDKRYILTFIDTKKNFDHTKIIANTTIDTFKLLNYQLNNNIEKSTGSSIYKILLIAMVLTMVFLVLTLKFLRSRQK